MALRTEAWTFGRSLSSFFYRRPNAKLILLLAPGLLWLVVLYLGSLFSLLIYSFYRLQDFTGLIEKTFGLSTYQKLVQPANIDIIKRTAAMAAAVTIACALIAFPIAYYTARVASPRMKTFLYLSVLVPLWSSYLVRVYAWKFILAKDGILFWFIEHLQLEWALDLILRSEYVGGPSLSQSYFGMWIVFTYTWLPYMILPLQAALERVPGSFMEASSDLGAHPTTTFRRVVLPLVLPGLVAGSIFTFSLTLGDFIIPQIVGRSEPFIGYAVVQFVGVSRNIPLAAAFSVVPMAIMVMYLWGAKRSGAFEAL